MKHLTNNALRLKLAGQADGFGRQVDVESKKTVINNSRS